MPNKKIIVIVNKKFLTRFEKVYDVCYQIIKWLWIMEKLEVPWGYTTLISPNYSERWIHGV